MLSKTKKLIVAAVAPIVSLATPMAILASNSLVPTELSKTGNIGTVVSGIIRFILIVAFVIAFIMLIIGGIRWILAGGDEKKVEGARGTITAALIGLVIVLLAYAIIRVVEVFFAVNIISTGICIPKASGGCATL